MNPTVKHGAGSIVLNITFMTSLWLIRTLFSHWILLDKLL